MKRKRLADAMSDRLPDWWIDRFGKAGAAALYQARRRTAALHRQLLRIDADRNVMFQYSKNAAKRRARSGTTTLTLFGVPVERKVRRDGVPGWEYVRY